MPPPNVKSLTATATTDLMQTPTRDPAPRGGRHHRNARPASSGMGGRLRAESPAEFVGTRNQRVPCTNTAAGVRAPGARG
jgi:hypothetical protein